MPNELKTLSSQDGKVNAPWQPMRETRLLSALINYSTSIMCTIVFRNFFALLMLNNILKKKKKKNKSFIYENEKKKKNLNTKYSEFTVNYFTISYEYPLFLIPFYTHKTSFS